MGFETNTGAVPDKWNPDALGIAFPGDLDVGLEFFQVLLTGINDGMRNWSEGKLNPARAGFPQDMGSYVRFHASVDFLTSKVIDPGGPSTMLIVAKAVGDQDPGGTPQQYDPVKVRQQSFYMGSSTGDGRGQGIWVNTPNTLYAMASYTIGGQVVTRAAQIAAPVNNWLCLIAKFSNTQVVLKDMVSGVKTVTNLEAGAQRFSNANPVKVGSADGAVRQGYLDCAISGLLSRFTTDDEDADLYVLCQDIMASVNIGI